MTNNGWWVPVGLAFVAGAAAGGWFVLRVTRVRYASQMRKSNDEMQQKLSATIDQLRAAQVRAQTEREQARNSFKNQLEAVAEAPHADYDEMDRMRRGGNLADTAISELGDGFAATRPMHEGL